MKAFLQFLKTLFFKPTLALSILFLLSASSSWGQIAQRGTATAATSTTTTVTVTKPTGLAFGDVMIATINQADNDGNDLANATLTGWTLLGGARYFSDGDNEWWGTVLYKVANASDVAAASFEFTGDGDADDMQASIIAFSGVDRTNPIDIAGTFTSSSADDASLSATSITTTTNNAAVVMLAMISDNRSFNANWSTTSPGSLTELFDVPFDAELDMGIGGAWALQSSAGATGNGTVTLSGNARDGAILIALRRAPLPGSAITTTFTTSGSFTVPNCVTSLTVEAWGGGGGGSTITTNTPTRGGGGGGGAFASSVVTVVPSNSYNYTVGAGGGANTAGSNTTFNTSTVVAAGGSGGTNNAVTAGAGGTVANSTGTTRYAGGNGAAGGATFSGGGGGGAGSTGAGGNAPTATSGSFGAGTSANGGNGGASVSVSANGNNGSTFGGGGSGASTNNNSDRTGGSGANGLLRLTYTLPNNPTITLTNSTATACFSASAQNVTLAYSATTGCPDMYSIDFASGITDVVNANLSGSSITIALPANLAAGSYTGNLTVMNSTYGFVSSTSSITVTVTENNTISLTSAAGTNSQNNCINNAITDITYSTATATGATVSGLPSGVTGSWSANVFTISGTPTVSGTFSYTVTMTGGCTGGTNTATGSITVNQFPPNISNFSIGVTNPAAGGTSTVTINSSSLASGTYTVTYNLTGDNTATGSTASVTIASGTGTFSTSALPTAGYTTVTITAISSASTCRIALSSGNTATILIPTAVSTTITTTGTWTAPVGVTSVRVEAWGGGGRGGSSVSGDLTETGGGGGGAYARANSIAVTAGTAYTVTVGAGSSSTSAGGDSWFNTSGTVLAKGGNSVANNSATGAAGGSAFTSIGDVKRAGGNGATASQNTFGGGGGSSAGTEANGANGSGSSGGTAPSEGGNGGGGSIAGGNGTAGAVPGGGGGGVRSFGDNPIGGAGARGQVRITYNQLTYKSQIISANLGSSNWRAGETRNVTVTIKNIGTATWTDGASGTPVINIGVKWNTNGGNWADYNVRTNANNLAPGETRTYTLTIRAQNNNGTSYGTNLATGNNNLTFDVVYEGISWFGNNNGGVGSGNTVFTSAAQTILAPEALPVTLSSFTAKPTPDNKVSLAWVTSTEQVNKGFRIERQAGNDNGKFEQIGFVGSKAKDGNSQSTLTYNFIDAAPKVGAASFYRLVQEDLDGTKTYSEVRVVKLNGQSVSMVFPNPSNGAVNISRTADGRKMNIQVIDQSGRIVSQVNNITDANYRINISQSGVYSIKMMYPETGEQSTQRVVVQK